MRSRVLDSFLRRDARESGGFLGYSRLVFAMKVLLPALALTIATVVVLWPELNEDQNRFRLTETKIDEKDADRLEMRKARYLGSDEEGQPYMVTADSARQDSVDGEQIFLEQPNADLTLLDGTWIALTAAKGVYEKTAETIELSGGVSVFHDQGIEFYSPTAFVDLAAGTTEGSQAVIGQGIFGTIEAESFLITERGNRIFFRGQATLVLYSEEGG